MRKILSVLLVSVALFLASCGDREVKPFREEFSNGIYPIRKKISNGINKRTQFIMGTVVEISVADEDKSPEEIKVAQEQAFTVIRKLEGLLSRYDKESEVYRLNELGGKETIQVSDETLQVIARAVEFNKLSLGAFDITISPLLELWGFYRDENGRIQPKEEIDEKLHLVGSDKIIIDKEKKQVGFNVSGMKIDLGGIAKGYAVDKAVEKLKENGIKKALVNAGGDIYCLGMKRDNEKWTIGLQHPRKPNQILAILELKDRAVATSGDYEKYFLIEGKRYPHIINPRTGYPIAQIPMSVTILAEDCITADSLSTSVFVLGPEEGLKLINSIEGVEGIIVSEINGEAEIVTSQGLEGKLKFNY